MKPIYIRIRFKTVKQRREIQYPTRDRADGCNRSRSRWISSSLGFEALPSAGFSASLCWGQGAPEPQETPSPKHGD